MNAARVPCRLPQLLGYFLRLGALGFGGPVALVAAMQRDLVEARGWITPDEYQQGLTLAQLAPGPLAAQLSIYLGYVRWGAMGAALTGLCFVLPSFLMVVGLGACYVRFGRIEAIQPLFYGIGAAVIGIIVLSAHKLSRRTLGKDPLTWGIAATVAFVTAALGRELVSLVLAGGFLVLILKRPPRLRGASASWVPLGFAAPSLVLGKLGELGWFFTKAGAFVFGSGLAIVPFLYGGVVQEHRWLTEQQFLDAVAVAMITPGPVVITVGFIGYLVAGLPGACVAALGTFLPCYLLTILPAPLVKRHGQNPSVKAFVSGVTAAAVGAIAGAAFVLGRRAIVDLPTAAIAALSLLCLHRFKSLPEPALIAGAALAGWILRH